MSSSPLELIDICRLAALLLRSPRWLYSNRPELHAAGMPLPLALPGKPVWRADEIYAWLSRRSPQAVPAAELTFTPVERTKRPDLRGETRGRPSRVEQMAAAAVGLSVREYRQQQRGAA